MWGGIVGQMFSMVRRLWNWFQGNHDFMFMWGDIVGQMFSSFRQKSLPDVFHTNVLLLDAKVMSNDRLNDNTCCVAFKTNRRKIDFVPSRILVSWLHSTDPTPPPPIADHFMSSLFRSPFSSYFFWILSQPLALPLPPPFPEQDGDGGPDVEIRNWLNLVHWAKTGTTNTR
jgi:hypothetical protein